MTIIETLRVPTDKQDELNRVDALPETSFSQVIDQRKEQNSIQILRDLAARDTDTLSSGQIRLITQIKLFLEWLDDDKPEVATGVGQADKFAALIALSRYYKDLNAFYAREVGVNIFTVRRWATGKSRPSMFVAEQIAREVRRQLVDALTGLAYDAWRQAILETFAWGRLDDT